jgi:hypothetical protein
MVLTKKGLERVYRLDKSIEQTNPMMVFLQIRLSPATAPKFGPGAAAAAFCLLPHASFFRGPMGP